MKSIIKNIGLQTIYQILATITPLITSPYLSRVLGAEGLGVYSYTYSIVNYFLLFAMLGVTNYGSRAIAMAKDEEEESRLFWEIHSLQILSTLAMILLYAILIFGVIQNNRNVSTLQVFWLLACGVDVNWFFFGKEEFKTTVTRNIVFKILTVVAIFVLVRSKEDVLLYTGIMAMGNFAAQIALYTVLFKKVKFTKPTFTGIIQHLIPNVLLFIPILAASFCSIMGKTMLGIFSDNHESGFYYSADKIIWIPLSIISGIGTVMLPKISAMKAKGEEQETRKLFNVSLNVFTCLAVAMSFGLAAVAAEFVPFFFGPGYETCIDLIILMAPVMVFQTLSNIIRTQYLIPYNKEKIYIIAVFAGAPIAFALNMLLIAGLRIGALGAATGALITELVVCLVQYAMCQKELKVFKQLRCLVPYCLFGFVMFWLIRKVALLDASLFVKLLIEIAAGVIVYVALVAIYLVLVKKCSLKKMISALKK